jgi:hypothetical protein
MDRDIILLLIGGLIGLLSSVITGMMNFTFERKRQKAQWSHELEIRNLEQQQKIVDDARSLLEKSNREKLSPILIPEGNLLYCFPGFTLITMSDNTTKKIEEIVVGDEVLSVDVSTKSIIKAVVKTIMTDNVQSYIVVNDLLHITQSHGVICSLDESLNSKHAGYLQLGDYLINAGYGDSLDKYLVTSLQLKPGPIKVYNLEIDDHKPFFASGTLVGDLSSKVPSTCGKLDSRDDDKAKIKR